MARIRTIKPEFWADEKIGPLDPTTRLVFLGLWSMADDAGRLIDSDKQIDAFIFPYTSETCRRSIDELESIGRIRRGMTQSGQRVIQIVNWHHQKIDKPNKKAQLPPIVEPSSNDRRHVDDSSALHTVLPVPATVVSVPTTEEEDTTQPVLDDGLAKDFERPEHREAYMRYRRAHKFPPAFDATVRAEHTPVGTGKGHPWAIIGKVFVDMQANGEPFNSALFRGYLRKASAPSAGAILQPVAEALKPAAWCPECGDGEFVERPGSQRLVQVHKPECSRRAVVA